MIPEIGHFALILALCLALLHATLPIAGAALGNRPWVQMARPLAHGQTLFLILAFGCLTYAFVTNDFSVKYTATNSNSSLPVEYRISAVWGGHEGSLLLWVLILGLWSSAVGFSVKNYHKLRLPRCLGLWVSSVSVFYFLCC